MCINYTNSNSLFLFKMCIDYTNVNSLLLFLYKVYRLYKYY